MGRGNNKKKNNRLFQPSVPPQRTDEYNLQQNFKKVRPYQQRRPQRVIPHTSDPSSEWVERNENDIIRSSVSSQELTTSSGVWGQYTHLDDKISDFQAQNEDAHLQIRKDFDAKVGEEVKILREDIRSKLPIKWYTWTVLAIVAIVSLIYLLSYSGVLFTQNKHTEEIKDIQIEINGVKNKVNTLQEHVTTLQGQEKNSSKTEKLK